MVIGAVDQVHAENAERVLLFQVGVVEHADMQDDLVRYLIRRRLEADADPAVAFLAFPEPLRRDGIGEGEKGGPVGAVFPDARKEQVEFPFQHAFEPAARNIAPVLGGAVYFVAELHVVGGHGLGDRAGGGAGLEKPAGDFLAGADFDDGAVFQRIQIDRKGFFDRAWHIVRHSAASPFDRARGGRTGLYCGTGKS